jgi:hypothetical protein
MKKSLWMILVLVVIGTTSASAQWQFGGGLSLGTEAGYDELGFGINARADYSLNEQWSIAPNFTFWFPSVEGGSVTMWQLNGDAHYNFAGNETMSFYGIGGLNYSYIKIEADGAGNWSADDSEIGLNLGAGANMDMFFGELKYDTAFEQIAITVGVLF